MQAPFAATGWGSNTPASSCRVYVPDSNLTALQEYTSNQPGAVPYSKSSLIPLGVGVILSRTGPMTAVNTYGCNTTDPELSVFFVSQNSWGNDQIMFITKTASGWTSGDHLPGFVPASGLKVKHMTTAVVMEGADR